MEVAVEVGVAVEETGVGVFVFVAEGVEVGVGVDVISGATVGEVEDDRLHIEKSLAMQSPEYHPSVPKPRVTEVLPWAMGTK